MKEDLPQKGFRAFIFLQTHIQTLKKITYGWKKKVTSSANNMEKYLQIIGDPILKDACYDFCLKGHLFQCDLIYLSSSIKTYL